MPQSVRMVAAFSLALSLVSEGQPSSLSVYHIGNSVTDTIRYPALKEMAQAKGDNYEFGRHMIPGAPLAWIFTHPADGFKEATGYYPEALTKHKWDVITLQPFDRHLEGEEGDVTISLKLIEMSRAKSPQALIYIYSRWPRRDDQGELDYSKKWLSAYTGGWDGTNESKDYFQKVLAGLKKALPKDAHRMFLVPVGDVLMRLDEKLKASPLPDIKGVKDLYVDGIHFGDKGAFVVGTVFYTVLFRKNPVGLPSSPYGQMSPSFTKLVQETAWEVARSDLQTGVVKIKTSRES